MPEMETIISATIEAAKLLRVEDELGSIEVGKIADIIAVSASNERHFIYGKCCFCNERRQSIQK